MKQRIFTASILILLAAPILIWSDTIVLNIAVALISAIGIYELLSATKYVQDHTLTVLSIIYSAAIPFLYLFPGDMRIGVFIGVAFVFVVALFMLLVFKNKKYRLEHISVAFLMATIIPVFLSSLIVLRRMPETMVVDARMSFVFMLLPIVCVILTDTFALFTGMLIGKHKLAPSVSPKKTVEGAIGGAVFGVLTFVVAGIISEKVTGVDVSLPLFAAAGLITSVIGQFGDLFMSVIKRHCDLKDFGNLMPGHGGILDRFDSLIFAAPTFLLFVYGLDYLGVHMIIH
ncbi:MAG: phosphatidate cytidylyltransferase [Clostridia bacterium]|nr:phosphatidate cytidylyltransferase [Clostridia bacterium]